MFEIQNTTGENSKIGQEKEIYKKRKSSALQISSSLEANEDNRRPNFTSAKFMKYLNITESNMKTKKEGEKNFNLKGFTRSRFSSSPTKKIDLTLGKK